MPFSGPFSTTFSSSHCSWPLLLLSEKKPIILSFFFFLQIICFLLFHYFKTYHLRLAFDKVLPFVWESAEMAAFCVFCLLLLIINFIVNIEVFMHFWCVFVFMSVFVFVFLITHSCWFPPFSSFQLPPRPGHCSTSLFKTTITARSFFSLHTFCLLVYLYNQFLSTRRY